MTISHLLFHVRHRSAFLTMSISAMFLILLLVSVGLSDSASVPISSSPTIIPNKEADDLELLASSKILMDHTSFAFSSTSRGAPKIAGILANTIGKHDIEDVRVDKNAILNVNVNSSISSGTNSTVLPVQTENVSEMSQMELEEEMQLIYSSGKKKSESSSYEMSSSLHVAHCRATCLQKFKRKQRTFVQDSAAIGKTTASPEGVHIQPRASSSFVNKGSSWSCIKEDLDCLECWKTCGLFEFRTNKNGIYLISSPQLTSLQEVATQDKSIRSMEKTTNSHRSQNWKRGQSVMGCSSFVHLKPCLAGCQIACSFLRQFPPTKAEGRTWNKGQIKTGSLLRKAIETETMHESLVKIVPGKITWIPFSSSSAGGTGSIAPVVYMVIQEYPDGKWRQIAQTTETSIDIPTGLASEMSSKLRSLLVLVVGPQGLQTVYSPEKIPEVEPTTMADMRSNSEKSGTIASLSPTGQSGNGNGEVIITTTPEESHYFSTSASTNDHLETDPAPTTITSSLAANDSDTQLDSTGETTTDMLSPSIRDGVDVENPFLFELRVVSLVHQMSLVIAELKWDMIGDNLDRSQEYLITWELTEGGLKGHLVTDSTSVTLSLWPDTTYQIQVEEFHQNLDSDGEQPTENPSASLKSLPIIVDTSIASFSSGKAAFLLSYPENRDDSMNEDEFPTTQTGNGRNENEIKAIHDSFMSHFWNMDFILSITVISAMLVLIILAIVTFAWIRARKAYILSPTSTFDIFSGIESGYVCKCLTHAMKEPRLLLQQDLVDSPSKIKTGFATKRCALFTLGTGSYKVGGQAEQPVVMPVAVINSSSSLSSGGTTSPVPSSPFHYHSCKNALLLPSLSSPRAEAPSREGLINDVSKQGCTSSSFCWLPYSSSSITNNTARATVISSPVPIHDHVMGRRT